MRWRLDRALDALTLLGDALCVGDMPGDHRTRMISRYSHTDESDVMTRKPSPTIRRHFEGQALKPQSEVQGSGNSDVQRVAREIIEEFRDHHPKKTKTIRHG